MAEISPKIKNPNIISSMIELQQPKQITQLSLSFEYRKGHIIVSTIRTNDLYEIQNIKIGRLRNVEKCRFSAGLDKRSDMNKSRSYLLNGKQMIGSGEAR